MKSVINLRPDASAYVEWKLTTPLLQALAAHVCVIQSCAFVCEECHQPIEADIHLNVGEARQSRIDAVEKIVR